MKVNDSEAVNEQGDKIVICYRKLYAMPPHYKS